MICFDFIDKYGIQIITSPSLLCCFNYQYLVVIKLDDIICESKNKNYE